MESIDKALRIAKTFNNNWDILPTQSGGWQLRLMCDGGALINYLIFPCSANLGEEGKPYQVNFRTIRNYSTLSEALQKIHA